jgi:hypothetical protein
MRSKEAQEVHPTSASAPRRICPFATIIHRNGGNFEAVTHACEESRCAIYDDTRACCGLRNSPPKV